jgi:hypothetical protein
MFIYDIDFRMNKLKGVANQLSWFYLAYLHAVTTFCYPDPFT